MMQYVRFFLRCLGLGVLVWFLPSVIYEFLKYRSNNTRERKEAEDLQAAEVGIK